MGSENSKPSDVSDAAWNKVQQQKLSLIAEKEKEIKEWKKERQEKLEEFSKDLANYCDKCSVPKVMMLIPSYRKECTEAREKVFNTVTSQINITESIHTAVKVSNAVRSSW